MGTNKWKGSKMVINKRKAKETGNQQVKLGKSRFHGFPILNKMDRKSEDQTRSFFPLVKTCWLPFFNPILPKTCWLPVWISRPNFPKKKTVCGACQSSMCKKKIPFEDIHITFYWSHPHSFVQFRVRLVVEFWLDFFQISFINECTNLNKKFANLK